MRFTWSEAKRKLNIQAHGLDFVDTARVFDGPTFTFEDDRFEYSEQRFVTLGLLDGFVVSIPEDLRAKAPCRYAWTIKVDKLR